MNEIIQIETQILISDFDKQIYHVNLISDNLYLLFRFDNVDNTKRLFQIMTTHLH